MRSQLDKITKRCPGCGAQHVLTWNPQAQAFTSPPCECGASLSEA